MENVVSQPFWITYYLGKNKIISDKYLDVGIFALLEGYINTIFSSDIGYQFYCCQLIYYIDIVIL